MSTSLTPQDLEAIKGLVEDVVGDNVDKKVDNRFDELEQAIAAGFAEAKEDHRQVIARLDWIEPIVQAERDRNDSQDQSIIRIRKLLHAA